MWILVFIYITPFVSGDVASLQPMAINAMGPRVTFNSMFECFDAREKLSETAGIGQGYFGPGKQAVCIEIIDPI